MVPMSAVSERQPVPDAQAAPEQPTGPASMPGSDPTGGYDLFREQKTPGLLRRLLTTQRHFLGLLFGGIVAYARDAGVERRNTFHHLLLRGVALPAGWLVDSELRAEPFPVQLRKRLELLGTTYIKLGQILSLRQDLLPPVITNELQQLLARLPALPFDRFLELVTAEIGRPTEDVFSSIHPEPLGSASIGQIHRATTIEGEEVVLKLVKPGIRETLQRDVVLLRIVGQLLEWIVPRVQPKKTIREFCDYTLREVDLRLEADNADTFSANFSDEPDIVFPTIRRDLSTRNLLIQEFFNGVTPGPEASSTLDEAERARMIDLGAKAIVRMLYKDGFFHADLHPGNLMILPGGRVGFIDLGMVGRFHEEVRRGLLYYYYSLVMGDAEGAARYLTAMAEVAPRGDAQAFRHDVEEICRRWQRGSSFADFSIGRLILACVARGAWHRLYFPVEMVLMVKALVTFEGVGRQLDEEFDVRSVSQRHINQIFIHQFSPMRIAREGLRGAPELVDVLVKSPMLLTEGMRFLEQATRKPPENPLAGLRGTMFAGACIVSGAVLLGLSGPTWLGIAFLVLGFLTALKRS